MVLLADGMGGHRAGNIASEMAVTDLGAAWVDTDIHDVNGVREWFAEHLEAENKKINEIGKGDEFKGMGTTLEAIALMGREAIFAHVGDSRISLIRQDQLRQLTSDHSLVNALLQAGQLTPEEAERHPQRYVITQSVGQDEELKPDINLVNLEPSDYLLVCSDGLTNMVSADEIYDIISSDIPLAEKASTLVRFANNAGGLDNITVALVRIDEEDLL